MPRQKRFAKARPGLQPRKWSNTKGCKVCQDTECEMEKHISTKEHFSKVFAAMLSIGPRKFKQTYRYLRCFPQDKKTKDTLITTFCSTRVLEMAGNEDNLYGLFCFRSGVANFLTCQLCSVTLPELDAWMNHVTSAKHNNECHMQMEILGPDGYMNKYETIPAPFLMNRLATVPGFKLLQTMFPSRFDPPEGADSHWQDLGCQMSPSTCQVGSSPNSMPGRSGPFSPFAYQTPENQGPTGPPMFNTPGGCGDVSSSTFPMPGASGHVGPPFCHPSPGCGPMSTPVNDMPGWCGPPAQYQCPTPSASGPMLPPTHPGPDWGGYVPPGMPQNSSQTSGLMNIQSGPVPPHGPAMQQINIATFMCVPPGGMVCQTLRIGQMPLQGDIAPPSGQSSAFPGCSDPPSVPGGMHQIGGPMAHASKQNKAEVTSTFNEIKTCKRVFAEMLALGPEAFAEKYPLSSFPICKKIGRRYITGFSSIAQLELAGRARNPYVLFCLRCGVYNRLRCQLCGMKLFTLDCWMDHLRSGQHNLICKVRMKKLRLKKYLKVHSTIPADFLMDCVTELPSFEELRRLYPSRFDQDKFASDCVAGDLSQPMSEVTTSSDDVRDNEKQETTDKTDEKEPECSNSSEKPTEDCDVIMLSDDNPDSTEPCNVDVIDKTDSHLKLIQPAAVDKEQKSSDEKDTSETDDTVESAHITRVSYGLDNVTPGEKDDEANNVETPSASDTYNVGTAVTPGEKDDEASKVETPSSSQTDNVGTVVTPSEINDEASKVETSNTNETDNASTTATFSEKHDRLIQVEATDTNETHNACTRATPVEKCDKPSEVETTSTDEKDNAVTTATPIEQDDEPNKLERTGANVTDTGDDGISREDSSMQQTQDTDVAVKQITQKTDDDELSKHGGSDAVEIQVNDIPLTEVKTKKSTQTYATIRTLSPAKTRTIRDQCRARIKFALRMSTKPTTKNLNLINLVAPKVDHIETKSGGSKTTPLTSLGGGGVEQVPPRQLLSSSDVAVGDVTSSLLAVPVLSQMSRAVKSDLPETPGKELVDIATPSQKAEQEESPRVSSTLSKPSDALDASLMPDKETEEATGLVGKHDTTSITHEVSHSQDTANLASQSDVTSDSIIPGMTPTMTTDTTSGMIPDSTTPAYVTPVSMTRGLSSGNMTPTVTPDNRKASSVTRGVSTHSRIGGMTPGVTSGSMTPGSIRDMNPINMKPAGVAAGVTSTATTQASLKPGVGTQTGVTPTPVLPSTLEDCLKLLTPEKLEIFNFMISLTPREMQRWTWERELDELNAMVDPDNKGKKVPVENVLPPLPSGKVKPAFKSVVASTVAPSLGCKLKLTKNVQSFESNDPKSLKELIRSMKPEDKPYFGKLLSAARRHDHEGQLERGVLNHLFRIKNDNVNNKKHFMCRLSEKAVNYGAGPIFNQLLPLLTSPTLLHEDRYWMFQALHVVLPKLDHLVTPYVPKIMASIEPLLIHDDPQTREEGRKIISELAKIGLDVKRLG